MVTSDEGNRDEMGGMGYLTPTVPLKVGVIFCTSGVSAQGREWEKVADCEILEVANAIQLTLEEYGFVVDQVDLDPNRIKELSRFDAIFNLTETIYGYPLTEFEVAEKMEQENIRFTGAGSLSLRTCLDKASTKIKLIQAGLPTPAFEVFSFDTPIQCHLRYPVIVKPIHEDGSIGITKDSVAWTPDEFVKQVKYIHRVYFQAAIVEEFIIGRDITASILGNGEDAVVLPLSECTYPSNIGTEFLSFEAKWLEDSLAFRTSKAVCPCDLRPEIELKIKILAQRACRLLGCRDYTRVDFRLSEDQPFILEVNPNPCINPKDSGFVRCCNAAGINYQQMAVRILARTLHQDQEILLRRSIDGDIYVR